MHILINQLLSLFKISLFVSMMSITMKTLINNNIIRQVPEYNVDDIQWDIIDTQLFIYYNSSVEIGC